MLRRRAGDAISGESVERLPQAPLGVESGVGHGHRVHYQRVSPKSFDLESEPLEVFAIRIERLAFGGAEMQRKWKE